MLASEAKILLVDDSRLVRMSVARIFNKLGYANLIEAENGEQAVARHAADHPDLILLDIVMPVMTGEEALSRIRAVDQATPIAMLSSIAKESQIEACRSLGITEFIVKPLSMETGPDTINALLARL
jgi:two-component system chemotaxis response regulator CheY